MIKQYPSQGELWRLFNYENGELKSKIRKGKWPAGRSVGVVSVKGRWVITIDGSKYFRSILIYIYFYGYPKYEVDHLDRDKINDRIANLEDKT